MSILQSLKKDFPWKKPSHCPNCRHTTLWGHGFVLRYFDDLQEGLLLKRYRCPNCWSVHTIRPIQYLPRIQASLHFLFSVINSRLRGSAYLKVVGRQRQQYWHRGFKQQKARLSLSEDGFVFLLAAVKVQFPFVSHSLKPAERKPHCDTPYLSFAATKAPKPP